MRDVWLLGLILSLVAGCDKSTQEHLKNTLHDIRCVQGLTYRYRGIWTTDGTRCLDDPTRDPADNGAPPSR